MNIFRTKSELVSWRAHVTAPVALVPTMGFLHEGHRALIDRARKITDTVVLSLFVNPTQFSPDEDLDTYPRDFERDRQIAENDGVSTLFAPDTPHIYHPDHATFIHWPKLGSRLCGASRPHHFQGVGTVVLKLFHLIRPAYAVFGRKDGQQALLITRLVTDMDLPIDIIVHPTVREPDGLALSSRNAYLDKRQRKSALALFTALSTCESLVRAGERQSDRLSHAMQKVFKSYPGFSVEYCEIVNRTTLQPVETIKGNCMIAIAGRVGSTRLIDNVWITEEEGEVRIEL